MQRDSRRLGCKRKSKGESVVCVDRKGERAREKRDEVYSVSRMYTHCILDILSKTPTANDLIIGYCSFLLRSKVPVVSAQVPVDDKTPVSSR